MTALLPAQLASFLNAQGLVFLSELIGAIGISSLIILLGAREALRGRIGDDGRDDRRHLLNAMSLSLSIILGVVIIERFLLLQ
jgi:hypothetical protein